MFNAIEKKTLGEEKQENENPARQYDKQWLKRIIKNYIPKR